MQLASYLVLAIVSSFHCGCPIAEPLLFIFAVVLGVFGSGWICWSGREGANDGDDVL
jgi:hypothetical protein